MSLRDKLFGGLLCLLSLVIAAVYFYVLFVGPVWMLDPLLVLEIVVSLFFVFGIIVVFWIGYTIMTTPSIEEIEKSSDK
ncbi:MAG: transcriptional regulator [archaeon]